MFILAEKASFPIDWMCQKLDVSRASFYRWLRPTVRTPTQVRHDVLDAHVVRVFTREKGMAGRDQITMILGQEGVSIAGGTVGAILNGHGLRAVRMRAWKKTTTVDPDARTGHIKNHMLDREGVRDFTSAVPGTRFCGDITYLRTAWLVISGDRDRSVQPDGRGLVHGESHAHEPDHRRSDDGARPRPPGRRRCDLPQRLSRGKR